MVDFSVRLKFLRMEQHLTQTELSKILGVSQGTLGNYETGLRAPDLTMLGRIADYFDVSTDYLLGRCDVPMSESLKIEREAEEELNRKAETFPKSNTSEDDLMIQLQYSRDILLNHISTLEADIKKLKKMREKANDDSAIT